MIFWTDFETASECDLPEAGVYNYARHPSTRVLCMSYAFNDGPVMTWRPGEPMPEVRGQIRAHNAAFERLIFWHVLGMDIPLEQFYCTAAQARANCAPGSLEDVGRFAGLSMRKDHRGAYLVRKCCMPPFNTELLPELIEYCETDVRVMRAASQAMRELTPEELEDYHVNERINDRGVLVDINLCSAAVKYAADELREIEATVVEITGGEVTSVRSPRMRLWVQERLGPEALKLMQREDKMSIDKTVRANLLAMDDPEEVPPDVKEVIQCADDLWASSVAKFNRLRNLACADGRVRGAFVFAGGSATGRASSYGAQVHNFTRKCADDPASVRHAMVRGHAIVPKYGRRVTDVLRGMLRPALIPAKGSSLVVADWSAIESVAVRQRRQEATALP
jgi:DNA polymerase